MPESHRERLLRYILAANETALHYSPALRGTFEIKDAPSIFLVNSNEKRQATDTCCFFLNSFFAFFLSAATPIFDKLGEMVVLQVIWRGETQQCHAQIKNVEHLVHSAIVQEHAAKKAQTGLAFLVRRFAM